MLVTIRRSKALSMSAIYSYGIRVPMPVAGQWSLRQVRYCLLCNSEGLRGHFKTNMLRRLLTG